MSTALTLAIPWFESYLAVLMRVLGILSAFPLLGSAQVPAMIRMAVGGMVSLVLLPLVDTGSWPATVGAILTGLVAEVVIGLAIGMVSRLFFVALDMAGEFVGTQMGLQAGQLFDPVNIDQVPLTGTLLGVLAGLTWLAIDGHYGMMQALVDSFELMPVFQSQLSPAVTWTVVHQAGGMFVIALQLAWPILLALLLANLALALMGRAVHTLGQALMGLNFAVGIVVGILVLMATLPLWGQAVITEWGRALDHIQVLTQAIGQTRGDS